ncbi:Anter-specific proline-rich protein APG [Fusarium austroafricanum]|uniref:Anter-specific proline-rich protein APG n=1 Tax=Fusarium austroafricanum TaxID=2364996 RepID=A0A8H4NNI0_9HYPO|nr:Anter-specific proline-rich protein APG [Fusarium austroafricanum]
MKVSIFVPLVQLLPCTAAAPSSGHSTRSDFNFADITKIVSFGDSWTSTQFDRFGIQPSASNPIGNRGRTSSNGRMWPEYLTTQYNMSSVLLYNMAVGGAVVDMDIVKTGPNDMEAQVHDRFQVYANKPGFFPPKQTLWTVFIGINDIYRTLTDDNQEEKIVSSIELIRELTLELYGYGARQFLFISTPPQSLFPNNKGKTIVPKLDAAVLSWNKQLDKLVRQMDQKMPQTKFFLFDIVPLLTAVTNDSSQFPETAVYKSNAFCAEYKTSGTSVPDFKSEQCEYNALEYMYIDGAHPTQPFHQLVAKKIAAQLAAGQSIS